VITRQVKLPGTPAREVFCDALSVTSPLDNQAELLRHFQPYMDGMGATLEVQADNFTLWRGGPLESSAVLRVQLRHQVVVVTISGMMCEAMRQRDWWAPLLAGFAGVPHRVTSLHATLERDIEAAPVIAHALEVGYLGQLQITRKRVRRDQVQQLLGYYELDDALTGTVYLGTPDADARLVIYDKRKEQFDKHDVDVGPRVRWELRFKSGIGVTLHDAHAPTRVFWHHMPSQLLARPDGVHSWSPSAEGFTLASRPELTPAELMARKLEYSPDVARLLELAAEAGPLGLDLLVSRLRRLYAQREAAQGPPQAVEGRSPVHPGVH
jgi:hypothetical protein